MTNMLEDGNEPNPGDDAIITDVMDTYQALKFKSLIYCGTTNAAVGGIISHSGTSYSFASSNVTLGDVFNTHNSGKSFTNKNNSANTYLFIKPCEEDRMYGFAIEASAGSAQCSLTQDYGFTWTDGTSPSFGTMVYDASFPEPELIVVAGDDSAGSEHIVLSTDKAQNFVDATTQPNDPNGVHCIHMLDVTTGYCVGAGGTIYKTSSGAVNWADTGHNLSTAPAADAHMSILTIGTGSTAIINSNGYITLYNNPTGDVNIVAASTSGLTASGGIVKTTNGDIYALMGHETDSHIAAELYWSQSSGTIGSWNLALVNDAVLMAAHGNTDKCCLDEFGSNNLLISLTNKLGFLRIWGR